MFRIYVKKNLNELANSWRNFYATLKSFDSPIELLLLCKYNFCRLSKNSMLCCAKKKENSQIIKERKFLAP